jgi:hypothetical protein
MRRHGDARGGLGKTRNREQCQQEKARVALCVRCAVRCPVCAEQGRRARNELKSERSDFMASKPWVCASTTVQRDLAATPRQPRQRRQSAYLPHNRLHRRISTRRGCRVPARKQPLPIPLAASHGRPCPGT